MADVTVGRARREEVIAIPAEEVTERRARPYPSLSGPLIILWTTLVLVTAAFLAFGSLWVDATNSTGRRMLVRDLLVREIWSRFVEYLKDQGASGPLILLVTAAAIATLVIAAFAFWLALALRDAPPESAADTSAEM